jgi:hypothetical protein
VQPRTTVSTPAARSGAHSRSTSRRPARRRTRARDVGAARDGGRGGEQADASVPGDLRGHARLGLDHAHDGHPIVEVIPQSGQGGRGRGVASHDEQLRPGAEQDVRELEREGVQLVGGAAAVGEAGRVPEVEEVLVRERDEALVEHREAADSGVEHGDREIGSRRGRHAPNRRRRRRGLARKPPDVRRSAPAGAAPARFRGRSAERSGCAPRGRRPAGPSSDRPRIPPAP